MSGIFEIIRKGSMAFLYVKIGPERYKVTRGLSGTLSVHILMRDRLPSKWRRLWHANSKKPPGDVAQAAIDVAAKGKNP